MEGLSSNEIKRYSRHLLLSGFGKGNQIKLKQSKVLVVGAGGLGCPVLLYLSAAGVGTIGIVDYDTVDITNLQRQVLYTEGDIGASKAKSAATRLSQLNSHINFQSIEAKLNSENCLEILRPYDVIVDGTDNFATRYLLNDACILLDKPIVYGSILKFEGHVSVFNFKKQNGDYSSNYRDLFPTPPDPDSVPNCEEAGVLGVLPGMIGTIQANEVIKILTGIHEPLIDTLLILDAETMDVTKFKIQNRGSRNNIKNLIDYDLFCKSEGKSKSLSYNSHDYIM
jgi:adenylyltransferase/sulfurtransferase